LTPRIKALKNSGAQLTIQKVGKFHLYADDQVQSYVRGLGNKLIPEYQRSMEAGAPDKINFQFFVVDEKAANAFSLSNGTVVIYSKFFELLENEAQLAAIIGHEMSHAIQEHTYREMQYHKKALLALRIGGAIAASQGYYSLANAATLFEAAVRNGYSRSLEDQADRMGLQYMIDAGYDPREAARVWKVLTLAEGDKATNFFWSDHNNNTTRRSYLMAELKNNYADLDYSRLQKGEESFASVAGRVKSHAQGAPKVKVKY
jgi:predicted Zn-dependent protease